MSDEIGSVDNSASIAPMVKELERLFSIFNKQFFNSALLKPVITLSQRGTKAAKGWCTAEKVWARTDDKSASEQYYEINICPEYLNRPVEGICETLLHEMVHLFNIMEGTQDCGSNGQYHNKHFKTSAEAHGLNVEKTQRYGYAKTSLKPETAEFVRSLDLTAFDLYRESEQKAAEESKSPQQKPSSTRKYICPKCRISIRATKEVRVRCDTCNELFVESNQQAKGRQTKEQPTEKHPGLLHTVCSDAQ